MKKIYCSVKVLVALLFFFVSLSSKAQNEINNAKSYLLANSAKEKLSSSDINEMTVSSSYLSPSTGWYHIYFNQTYENIEVYNALLNVTMKNNQVSYVTSSFVDNIALRAGEVKALKSIISPIQAIQGVAKELNLEYGSTIKVQETAAPTVSGAISSGRFTDSKLSDGDINVKLYWLPYEETDATEKDKSVLKVALTYSIRFLTKDGKNSWNVHVDANSGKLLRQVDEIIHCDFGVPHQEGAVEACNHHHNDNTAQAKIGGLNKPLAANEYNVFDYPLESPIHGARTVVSSPYTRFAPASTGPGTTNGWHNDGTTDYTTTRGNNVFAKDDLAADNETTIGSSPTSATLDFNYPYTQDVNTAAGNLNAAITNLFYWNNVMHDVLYRFGFDEPSGNFQRDNMSRGGAGNDFVQADAQDGSGTNNANFSTPTDGTNPRMQMFIWSNAGSPTYQPDSDFDNGIIAHEYGHGWSNRLTGGPNITSCLANAEQGGEGWSDYIALMTVTNWGALTPTLASANIPRGIGTYAIGQPTTGGGIRPFRYSYDMANINSAVTYGGVSNPAIFSQPHGIGSIWATMLWDMTWEIILQDAQIGCTNIYDVPANIADYRGAIAALKLVNEGLRMQQCMPSFVQARDAIMQADQMLFNGRYRCAIGNAFARRGLGYYASTGTTTNDRTVKEDFTPFPLVGFTNPTPNNACSGQPFTYTATPAQSGTYTYSWARGTVAGISNPANSANSNVINETLINTTSAPINVQYVFTVTGTNTGGCSGTSFIPVIVTVNPAPVTTDYSVCQNAAVPVGEGMTINANATVTSVSGVLTATSPTYVKPNGDNITTYAPSWNVLYKAYYFVAPSSGTFTFAVTAASLDFQGTGAATSDTYMSLYQNSFDPNSPATNFLRGDDDISGADLRSSLTHTLTAGTPYILVVSGWFPSVVGTFTFSSTPGIALQTNQWFTAQTGGASLFTGSIFNPVGVAGSGVPNTSTVGTTTFYVNEVNNAASCRFPVKFTVGSVGGTVSSSTSVCSVSNGGTLTLSGHSGTILNWESSIDNFVSDIQTIANTTTTLTYSNLTQTTSYRAVVQTGTCDPANSVVATVTVNNTSVAGSVTGGMNVCSGTNGGTLTLAGYEGSIVRWESSIDNFVSDIQTISNTTTTQAYSNLTQTTSYRAVVQNGTCDASNSTPTTVSVATLQAGTVTGSDAVCATSNSGTMLLTGSVGNVIRWESSIDDFATSTPIVNTGLVQTYTNLTQTTKFRAVLGLDACANVNSTPATITVSQPTVAGTITSSASPACAGSPITLTLAGNIGNVLAWQVSGNNFVSATGINNTNTSITSTPLVSVQYRAYVRSGSCNVVTTDIPIIVSPVPTISAPTVTQPTCTTDGSITINATGLGSRIIDGFLGTGDATQTGRIVRNSTVSGCGTPKANPGLQATTGARFADSYTFTNTSASSVCISVTLQSVNGLGMYAVLYNNTFNPANTSTNYAADPGTSGIQTTFRHTVAAGATVVLVVSAINTTTSGSVGNYRLSIDGFDPLSYSIDNGANWQASNSFPNLAANTYNIRARSNATNSCPANFASNPVTLTVQGTSVGGTLSADASHCGSVNSGTLTLSGNVGNVVRWESSIDNFVSDIQTIANTTTTLNYSNLTQTTKYRAVVKDGICAEVNSSEVTITINPIPVPNPSSNSPQCEGSILNLTSVAGMSSYAWMGPNSFSSTEQNPSISNATTATSGTYTVTVTGTGGCTASATVAVQVNPLPVPNPSSNSPQCTGSMLNLTSVASMNTYTWMGPNSFSSTEQNPSISSVTTAASGTYTITVTDANGCSASATTVVVINITPTKPSISPRTSQICAGGSVSLVAICLGGTLNWTGGLTGSVVSVSPTATKNYKVACTNTSGCTSDSSDVATVTVMKPPKPTITPNAATICLNSAVTLTSSACDGGYGTLSWTDGLIGTSMVVQPQATKSYKVLCTSLLGCKSDSSDATTITVVPIPNAPTAAASQIISSGSTATLTATCASGTPVWYASILGGTALGMGTYTTPALTINTNYFVACETNPAGSPNCTSYRVSQGVQIDVFAIVNQPTNAIVCSGQNAIFTVDATGINITFQWQENTGSGWTNVVDGGVYSGATTASLNLTSPPTSMDTYEYRCILTNGLPGGTPTSLTTDIKVLAVTASALANNLIIVSPFANVTNTFSAVQTVTATNVISGTSQIDYFAGNSITLNPGFKVTASAGSAFKAKIQTPCTNTSMPIPDVLKK